MEECGLPILISFSIMSSCTNYDVHTNRPSIIIPFDCGSCFCEAVYAAC